MTKYLFYLIALTLFLSSCSSEQPKNNVSNTSMKEDFPNLVQVDPPENIKAAPSKVYVDSIKIINHNNEKMLLISGNFANSCTSIKKVTYSTKDDTLVISIKGWMPADKLCATVLTPFSFIFNELVKKSINQFSAVEVNGKTFSL